jgi:EAL domain-containing protein (putative c-di-GMP-specific phosphodiesterase class I)
MHAALFWRHPERGLLQPREFASLAEETGMMAEVGRRMLLDTCCKVEGWNGARSGDSLALYITFDARYLRYPDLIRAAADVLRESGLGASSLVLEVSGSAAVQEQPESLSALQMLKDDLGVRVSIDGISFGGSSDIPSSRLPADQVKLGEARIRGLEASSADAEIVSATIRVAHALDLQILAEGVENVRQLKRLREIGCDLARGGYFSELLSADEAERLLREALRW